MGSIKPLLQTQFKAFSILTLAMLLLSLPLYYYIIEGLWENEIDNQHVQKAQEIEQSLNSIHLPDIEFRQFLSHWEQVNGDVEIKETPVLTTAEHSEHFDQEIEVNSDGETELTNYRCYKTGIQIGTTPYLLVIKSNIQETEESLFSVALVSIAFFISLLLGFLFLNKSLSKSIWSPFKNTLKQLQDINLADKNNPVFRPTTIKEFEELNSTLLALITSNKSQYQEQKEFTENASHELQTPLAIMRAKIDLLGQLPLSSDESDILLDLNQAVTRSSRIIKNLLLLAKIENNQFPETEIIQLSEGIQENWEMYQEHFTAVNLSTSFSSSGTSTVKTNKVLFDILLNNLLSNSLKFCHSSGEVELALVDRKLIIRNSGFEQLNSEQIFTRFKTSESSVGSGLGLPLVQKICSLNGWKIAYQFINGMHNFEVNF